MRCLFLLALTISAFAAQSLQLGSGVTGASSLPNSAPFRRSDELTQSIRWEFRLHNIGTATGNRIVWQTNGQTYYCHLNTSAELWCTNWFDALDDSSSFVSVAGRTDIIVRVVRDVANTHFWVEIQNVDGSGYNIGGVKNITGLGTGPSSGGGTARIDSVGVPGDATPARLAWLRWRTGAVTAGSAMPKDTDTVTGYLGAWEFEGNGNDSSSQANNMSTSGATYSTSPTYAPACVAGASRAYRAGTSASLDGTLSGALNNNGSLTYLWQETAGPNTAIWSSHTSPSPTLTGLVTGTYTFSLEVKDSDGVTSSCSVSHGAVATDVNGTVLIPSSDHAKLISNISRLGVNPWPWFDDRETAFLDWLVSNIDTYYATYWDTAAPGTVTVTNGGSTIAGSGTTFRATFCGGGTTPTIDPHNGAQIVIWYPIKSGNGYDGQYGRKEVPIWQCTSDTVLQLGRNPGDLAGLGTWDENDFVASGSGLNYSVNDQTLWGYWNFGSRPLNYYDQVHALYSMYYRTGNTKYLTTARTLADRFWRCPKIDRGAFYDAQHGYYTWEQRSLQVTGLMLRASDGASEMWPALRRFVDYLATTPGNPITSGLLNADMRDDGFALQWIAEAGILDPTSRATQITRVVDALHNRATPFRQSDGSYNIMTGGWFSIALGGNTYTGTATVNSGSTAVSGTGTNFTTDAGPGDGCATVGNYIVFYPLTATSFTTPGGANTGDPSGYQIAAVLDASHITLATPYTGSGGSKYYACGSGALGMGLQPFMLGAKGQSFKRAAELLAYDSTKATEMGLYNAYAAGIGSWLGSKRSSDGGIFYFRTSPSCEGPIVSTVWCDTGPEANRINYAESAFANAIDYQLNPSGALKDETDAIWSMFFGKPATGAIATDSRYMSPLDGYMFAADNPNNIGKWLGFFFGYGRLGEWVGIRQGGLAAAVPRTPQVAVRFADHPLATKARLTVTDPTGNAVQSTCLASPCSISIDARKGAHLLKIELLNSSNAIVITSDPQPIQ